MIELKESFKPRKYQESIFNTCSKHNTMVVLPTGLGKTAIALMMAVHRLKIYPNSKFLMLAPSKPLVSQHMQTFKDLLKINSEEIVVFTGEIKPTNRKELWDKSRIIFSTPQTIANDIANKRISLDNVSCLVLDEAHKATGDYDYVWISKQYKVHAKYPRIIGLTASPGSKLENIKEICKNIFVEDIEVRNKEDPDVLPYVQETDIKYIDIELPIPFKRIQTYLKNSLTASLEKLKEYGYIKDTNVSRGELLSAQRDLQRRIATGEKSYEMWQCVKHIAEGIKINHAIGLLETQGIGSLQKYMEKLQEDARSKKIKSTNNIVSNPDFKAAIATTLMLNDEGIEHPKFVKLKEIVQETIKDQEKIIVFTQYRDSGVKIKNKLNELKNINAKLFVGQAKKSGTGLSQKEQIDMLKRFSQGEFNVLVATSVAEEGLDVPSVNLVLFYEPIPSAIRLIQRKGRTGRLEKGKVRILVTKNTMDEIYKWSSYHKEKRMHRTLTNLKKNIKLEKQAKLGDYAKNENALIIADTREPLMLKELMSQGMNVETKRLVFADFIIADIGIERKSVQDFVNSIVDKRLLMQVKELKNNFNRQLLILEGKESLYSIRNVHPNSIRGMLATIAISYNIPIINTTDFKETAEILKTIAKREFCNDKKQFNIITEKKPLSTKDLQIHIVSSLPGIGPRTAKTLLDNFKTIKDIVNADVEELKKIDGVGNNRAEEIKKILDEIY